MKEMFAWWFSPKRSYSVVKIPIACVIGFFFVSTLIDGAGLLVDAFRRETLFTGVFLFIFPPLIMSFFAGVILWGGLFYLPYHTLGEQQEGKRTLAKNIGILFAVFGVLSLINWFIWG